MFKLKKRQPLTEDNFFYANDPEYLKKKPDIKRRLIENMRNSKPGNCFACVFLAHREDSDGRIEFYCPLSCVSIELEKRAEGCILDA